MTDKETLREGILEKVLKNQRDRNDEDIRNKLNPLWSLKEGRGYDRIYEDVLELIGAVASTCAKEALAESEKMRLVLMDERSRLLAEVEEIVKSHIEVLKFAKKEAPKKIKENVRVASDNGIFILNDVLKELRERLSAGNRNGKVELIPTNSVVSKQNSPSTIHSETEPSGTGEEMKTLKNMPSDERSLLLFLEARAVDYGGRVDGRHMNKEDFDIAEKWNDEKFIKFGRIRFDNVNNQGANYVKLSDEAWKLAHEERRARSERMWLSRNFLGTAEQREIVENEDS